MRKSINIALASLILSQSLYASDIYTTTQSQTSNTSQNTQTITPTIKPSILDTPISINIKDVALPYLFSIISNQIGIPIMFRNIDYQTSASGGTSSGSSQNDYLKISYFADDKPLRHVLDEITSSLDLWWKYEDGRIVIYKYESKVFHLALPLTTKTIDEKSGALSLSYKRSFLDNLQPSLEKLLYDKNSKVSVDQMGYVFVYARKSEVETIEKAIDKINKTFTTTIPLKVTALLISDSDFLELGINLNYTQNGNNTLPFLNATLSGANQVSNPIFNLSVLTSYLQAKLAALAQSGKAYILENNYLTALNGQPVYYAPSQKQRIISKYELIFVPTAGPNTTNQTTVPTITVNTEDLNLGSSLVLIPYIIDEETKRIAVDIYRQDNTLNGLEYKTVNLQGYTNQIAIPNLSSYTNLNEITLYPGQTLALFTGAQTIKQMQNQGIPFLKDIPIIGYLFKEQQDTNKKFRLLILLTYEKEENMPTTSK
jgi:type II secretory pathway component GspD/PulD (secretin)